MLFPDVYILGRSQKSGWSHLATIIKIYAFLSMRLFYFTHQEIESISPTLETGLAISLANGTLANTTQAEV